MKPKIAILLVAILFVTHKSFTQQFKVPANVDLSNPDNFKKYEKDVINCENWLEKTPLDKEEALRKDVNTFLIGWISGCPYITLELRAETMPFAENSPEMLMFYMGGWPKYALEHPGDTDKIRGNVAGLKTVCSVYKANPSYKRDKEIDKLVLLNDKGKLEAWVGEQLKK